MSKQSIVNKVEIVLTDTTSQDIELPLNIQSGLIGYDLITAVDYTNSPTLIVLGFKAGASEYLLYGESNPAAQKPVSTPRRVYVPARFTPFARVRGGTSGDKIALFVYGYAMGSYSEVLTGITEG
jgi:hypothetical protein